MDRATRTSNIRWVLTQKAGHFSDIESISESDKVQVMIVRGLKSMIFDFLRGFVLISYSSSRENHISLFRSRSKYFPSV